MNITLILYLAYISLDMQHRNYTNDCVVDGEGRGTKGRVAQATMQKSGHTPSFHHDVAYVCICEQVHTHTLQSLQYSTAFIIGHIKSLQMPVAD